MLFRSLGRKDLLSSLGYGTLVLLERAAIGFAVATVLRSQLAGVVAGIGLSIGEGILSTVLFALAMSGDGLARTQTQWYQLLPFRIGESLLAAVRGPSSTMRSITSCMSYGLFGSSGMMESSDASRRSAGSVAASRGGSDRLFWGRKERRDVV